MRPQIGASESPDATRVAEAAEQAKEVFRAESRKYGMLSEASLDWKRLVSACHVLLHDDPQDLRAAGYLIVGLLHEQRFVGLRDGLRSLRAVIERRASASNGPLEFAPGTAARNHFEFPFETIPGRHLRETKPSHSEYEALREAIRELELIRGLLSDGPNTARPLVFGLGRALQDLLPADTRQTPAPSVVDGIALPKSLESSPRLKEDLFALVRTACNTLGVNEPLLVWPYRLKRVVAWVDVEDYPLHNEGRTRLPGPPKHAHERLRNLVAQRSWRELLAFSEELFDEYRFWFDLQRAGVKACEGLGPDFAQVGRAIREECEVFLGRLPGLVDFAFGDDTAFADAETRSWLSAISPNASGVAPDAATEPVSDELGDLRRTCQSLKAEGRLDQAVTLLSQRSRSSSLARQQFLVRRELARLLLDADRVDAALALYRYLDQDIQRFSLEAWEPDLSATVLGEFWKATQKSANAGRRDAGGEAYLEGLRDRLVLLDPSFAVESNLPGRPGKVHRLGR